MLRFFVVKSIYILPKLFPVLRVLVDRPENKARFLILGSASPTIIKTASETLAGRVEFIKLSGFNLAETGKDNWKTLWLRGGFPRAYLAESGEDSLAWREGFIRTFLERDIPQLGINIPAVAMRRFWTMLAHYHGQTWNASELGRSMGLSDKTVRSYLDIPDWHSLLGHPKIGASWEGFVIEQVLQYLRPSQAYFWATHGGTEIDLVFSYQGYKLGVEVKFNEAPKITKSMQTALTDLALDHLWIIYPGQESYPAAEKINVCSLLDIDQLPGQSV